MYDKSLDLKIKPLHISNKKLICNNIELFHMRLLLFILQNTLKVFPAGIS